MSERRMLSRAEVREEANAIAYEAISEFSQAGKVHARSEENGWTEADYFAVEDRLSELAERIVNRKPSRRRRRRGVAPTAEETP